MNAFHQKSVLMLVALLGLAPMAASAQNTNMWSGSPTPVQPAPPGGSVWAGNGQAPSVYAPADLDQRLSGVPVVIPPAPAPQGGVAQPYGNNIVPPYGAQLPYGNNYYPPNMGQGYGLPYGYGMGGYPPTGFGGYGIPVLPYGNVPTGGSPFFDGRGFGLW